ncbi:hypothetical protein CVT24_003127 [Panaeolus cyanescens]|uniref:Uncharacterized protein n=1 Tax=Panaeolus cyanescens TaxID=181874 RepID=A0A409W1P5_9AGAR|nr:hypothetical protein CVT24_003127 [Panaeolus cyanescens]
MSSVPHLPNTSRTGKDKPKAHFAPGTEALSRRRPSATKHSYSGPGSPLGDIPGAYPEPSRQQGSSFQEEGPPSTAFRSSGSMPSRSSASERDFLGSPIEDYPGESNPAAVEAALASVRPRGVGPISPPATPSTLFRGQQVDEEWSAYLESTNPIAAAHKRGRSARADSQAAEPLGYGSQRSAQDTALDESSFVSDVARDKGQKKDIKASMGSGEQPSLPGSAHPYHILEDAEDIAVGMFHEAEQVLHKAGSKAQETLPKPADILHSAEHAFHQAEDKAKSYLPSISFGTADKSQARSTLSHLGEKTGAGASYNTGQEYDLHGEKIDTNQFIFEDDITDNEGKEAVVVRPSMSVSKAEKNPESQQIPQPQGTESRRRDRLSDAARHSYSPSDGSIPPTRGFGEGDIAVGHGGVSFYRFGVKGTADSEGILPGYPTPAGMSKLVSDRMKEDRARAREVGKEASVNTIVDRDPTGLQVNVSPNSRIVQEMLDESRHPRSRLFKGDLKSDVFEPLDVMMTTEVRSEVSSPDLTTTNRKLEEVRQSPVFMDGQRAAEGKFEAIFDDVEDSRPPAFAGVDPLWAPLRGRTIIEKQQVPVFRKGSVATGQFEAPVFRDVGSMATGIPQPRQTGKGRTSRKMGSFTAPITVRQEGPTIPSTLDASRNPQEKHEIPIFKGGGDTAAGRFEAGYMDVTGSPKEVPEEPRFMGKKGATSAAGKFEATFDPQLDELRAKEQGRGTHAAPVTIAVPQHSTLDPNRNPQEKRSIPIFSGGGDTAAAKFEAEYMDVSAQPQEVHEHVEFVGAQRGATSAAGRFEALLEPNLGAPLQRPQMSEVDSPFAAPLPLRQEGPVQTSTLSPERQPEERREIPIFSGGVTSAAGKYEAGFMDVTGIPEDVPERPDFIGKDAGDAAAGKYEARMEPELTKLREGKGKEPMSNISGTGDDLNPVDYLGKPVSKAAQDAATSDAYRRIPTPRKNIN